MKTTMLVLTALFLLISLTIGMAISVSADTVYSGTWGDLKWTLNQTTGEVFISGSGDLEIPGYWRSNFQYDIKTVTIDEGITSIGEYAFSHCYILTSITIPTSVTSIGEYAFYNCQKLPGITIPGSVTSIGNYAFELCGKLENVTIFNGVTSIGENAFSVCKSLASITIPNSVTTIGKYAFLSCHSLTSIAIPDSVTSLGKGAFFNCDGLTSIAIPNSVTSIAEIAFSNCYGLTSVTIPNSVTSIGNEAFYDCTNLASIAIPNSVTSIGERAFGDCTNLTSIAIPDSVIRIGYSAFINCSALMNVSYCGTEQSWYRLIEVAGLRSEYTLYRHQYDEGVMITEPTHLTGGVKVYACVICEETKTEELPEIPDHIWDGGVCTVCGETEPVECQHEYSWSFVDMVSHKGVCSICGHTVTENHTWESVDGSQITWDDSVTVAGDFDTSNVRVCPVCNLISGIQATEKEEKTGCRGNLSTDAAVLILTMAGLACVVSTKKKKK